MFRVYERRRLGDVAALGVSVTVGPPIRSAIASELMLTPTLDG
ncbi:hypothetical protein BH10ACT3_BH10ACT3_04910 [soil metagenome]